MASENNSVVTQQRSRGFATRGLDPRGLIVVGAAASAVLGIGGCQTDATHPPEVVNDSGAANACPRGDCIGSCSPEILATGQASPGAIAVDSTNVYWANLGTNTVNSVDGTVMRLALADGGSGVIASGQVAPIAVEVGDNAIYWANLGRFQNAFADGALFAEPIGGGGNPVLLAQVPGSYGIAVDTTSIYSVSGRILRVPLDGGPSLTIFDGPISFGQIAIDSSYVYWTSHESGAYQGALARCGLAGCANMPTVLGSQQCSPVALAVDSNNVYWTNQDCPDGHGSFFATVLRTNLDGSETTILSSGSCHPGSIAVDQTNVYWTQDDAILRCPIEGCAAAPAVLVSGRSGFGQIVVDATSVFWTEPASGIVARVAK